MAGKRGGEGHDTAASFGDAANALGGADEEQHEQPATRHDAHQEKQGESEGQGAIDEELT
jgi:hypothetical protein